MMNRFKKILVLCQEDSQLEFAIERARALALANGAEVTLLDVIDFEQRDIADFMTGLCVRTSHDLLHQVHDYHCIRLESLAASLARDGLTVSLNVVHGVPFVETIRAVLRDNYDIVIKGAAFDQATKQSVFLGLDLHLMRKCPCPVMIINEPPINERPHVLAAVDPDSENRSRQCVNRLILDLSSSLCALSGSKLHVAHAWRIEEEQALLTGGLIKASKDELKQIKRVKRARRAQEIRGLLAHSPPTAAPPVVHLLQGHAGDVIPKLASSLHVELVVMGTVSRTDVSGLFIGSTAETIINRLRCSVLAVKPPEFRTPVELGQFSDIGERYNRAAIRAVA